MNQKNKLGEAGFTLVELTVTVVIIAIVVVSFFGLFTSLINSTIIAKRQAVALTLATNQVEYLKSLPYDSLAVQGGSISVPNPLPATTTQTINGVPYTITTSVSYVDDAYDGCGAYPTQALKQTYCRNYPPPTGAPATDQNPADYKVIHVAVTARNGSQLAAVDTQISARVSETASTTGALFVTVITPSGTPVSGATVSVSNTTVSPVVAVSDSSDTNGVAIFYGLPPDSSTDYVISATAPGYSSLTTINAAGSLQPTYANQKIISQQASYATLTIGRQGSNSLLIETTDTSGGVLGNVKTYIKGGYKKYTLSSDTSYYYDNYTPSDVRPTTDAGGLAGVSNLVPINGYTFCGDDGSVNCKIGTTTYYLAAAVPYTSGHSLGPITVPQYDPANPPSTTYPYNSTSYIQKVRLMLTTNANFPRIFTLSPDNVSLAGGGLGSFQIVMKGYNLTSATAKLTQGATTYNATTCSGSTTQLTCTFNLSTITIGTAQVTVTNVAGSLVLPLTPLGGFNVNP